MVTRAQERKNALKRSKRRPEGEVAAPANSAKKMKIDNALPVTVLSGFLGAGKTTLLKKILEQTHAGEDGPKYKVAVLVNDMAALNIDANLVRSTTMVQQEEKLFELHNGCICCTLREDLLEALAGFAAENKYDAVVVEGTGVSDPQEVAETFTYEVGEALAADPEAPETLKKGMGDAATLNDVARLDTCVTVIDCSTFHERLNSAAELRDAFKGSAEEEDERNVGPLLMGQIEFADVIVLNKSDLVSKKQAATIEAAVRQLNPTAKIEVTSRGEVKLDKLLCTNLFSMEKAENSPGWLQTMRGEAVTPETEVYNISSFVYQSRTPFHPLRLMKFIDEHFHVLLNDTSEDNENEDEDEEEKEVEEEGGGENGREEKKEKEEKEEKEEDDQDDQEEEKEEMEEMEEFKSKRGFPKAPKGHSGTNPKADVTREQQNEENEEEEGNTIITLDQSEESEDEDSEDDAEVRAEYERVAKKRVEKNKSKFGNIMRSKGHVWIAGRDEQCAEWGHAGAVLELDCAGPWMVTLPKEFWPEEGTDHYKAVMNDFSGETLGDRRQELVFIGQNLNQKAITAALDSLLVTKEDLTLGEREKSTRTDDEHAWKMGMDNLDDPFPKWQEFELPDEACPLE